MTALELRMKYKADTGYAPTYGNYAGNCDYKGGLKHEYAVWLENGSSKKRESYKRSTGNSPIYYDHNKDLHYFREYKGWLEERRLEVETILEKIKTDVQGVLNNYITYNE